MLGDSLFHKLGNFSLNFTGCLRFLCNFVLCPSLRIHLVCCLSYFFSASHVPKMFSLSRAVVVVVPLGVVPQCVCTADD